MGTCQNQKLCKKNHQRDSSQETASTDTYGSADPSQGESVLSTNNPSVRRRNRSEDNCHKTQLKCREVPKHTKKNPEQCSEEENGESYSMEEGFGPNLKVRQPSQLNESMMRRWSEPGFSEGEFFRAINFDRVFSH